MRFCIKRSNLILPIVLSLALGACQHADSDPRALAVAGGGASGNGSAPARGTSAGATRQDQDSDRDDPHDEEEDGPDSASSDDNWSARRKVPGGTLTWTVVYTANATLKSHDDTEVVTMHRTVHGRARMQGEPGSPDAQAPENSYTQADRAMRACQDDSACQQAEAAKLMARVAQDPQSFRRDIQSTKAALLRDTSWGGVSCTAEVEIDDRGSWSGISSDGYLRDIPGSISGKQTLDPCNPGRSFPRIVADDASKTYRLELPYAVADTLRKTPTKVPESDHVRLPDLVIKGIKYDTLDKPLSGSARLQVGSGSSVWKVQDVPLTEQVTWTFTPDAK